MTLFPTTGTVRGSALLDRRAKKQIQRKLRQRVDERLLRRIRASLISDGRRGTK